MSVTLQDYAALVGRSLPTVQAMVRDGMPTLGRYGREHRIAVGPAVQWLLDRIEARVEAEIAEATKDPELLAARTRKLTAEAQIAEVRLARDKGESVSLDAVILAGQTTVKGWTAKVRALPRQMVQAGLITREQEPAVAALLKALLIDIANWRTVKDVERAAVQAAQNGRTH